MKYLCLAYGREEDWKDLTKAEQHALLAQDDVIRKRGDFVAAAAPEVTTVRAVDGEPLVTDGSFARLTAPLAGFSIIEASGIDEVVKLVAGTPCAQTRGAIEIRPIIMNNAVRLEASSRQTGY